MLPGRTLHRLATHLCSTTTLERIVEPAIADLQKEYASADRASRRAWLLVTGYVAILKVMALCVARVSLDSADERRALTSALAWSAAMFVVVFALLVLLPLYSFQNIPRGWYAATTLVPQALPLAIPIGIAFGIAFGLHARPAASVRKMMLVCALAASVMSFGILAWAMPAGNLAFKELSLQKRWGNGVYHGAITEPWKGHNEMKLSEFRHHITRFSERGQPENARKLGFYFHLRFSLAVAVLALTAVLLVVPLNHRGLRGLLAFAAIFVYWALIYAGEALAVYSPVAPRVAGTVPPFVGAWLPNIVIGAFAIVVASSRSSRLRGSRSG